MATIYWLTPLRRVELGIGHYAAADGTAVDSTAANMIGVDATAGEVPS